MATYRGMTVEEIKINGEEHLIMREDEILAVLEKV